MVKDRLNYRERREKEGGREGRREGKRERGRKRETGYKTIPSFFVFWQGPV